MSDHRIRRMTRDDLPEAVEVDAECLSRPWSAAVWREELESPFGLYLALEEEGRIVAQIGVKRTSEELHVTTLAVRPECRRRGYARALVRAAMDAFPEVRRVHLEVRPSNSPARSLYRSLGFREVGRRPRYYGDEDAMLMTLDLSS
ncbi:ribosomal protein S18-alanine N-acetyltransferase [Rubrobacter naiadicus]|uniref:ribosomal protein S18-alanine N-acetyltransferase n=1 Tax=Rubrobacter naiadicus TaxID=1392641 RepID=UPI002360FF09|nr:ribosomal protein S18-alanine N-acetyltransferase [Rubrobacter naiadicus]